MRIDLHLSVIFLVLFAVVTGRAQPLSPEIAKEFPFVPVKEWKLGMPFIVLPPGAGFTSTLMRYTPGASTYTAPRVKSSDLVGQVFTFERLVAIKQDNRDFVLVVLKNRNALYAKVSQEPLARFTDPNAYQVELGNLAYLTDLEKARKLLTGKVLYPTIHQVIPSRDEPNWLPKFIPVKITKVEQGDESYPVRLTVEYPDKKILTKDYILSGTASRRDDFDGGTMFARAYSFTDPRPKTGIDEGPVWRAIQRGVPLKNMTMKECELAMGKPTRKAELVDEVKRIGWYYEVHLAKSWILEFKNGILDKYVSYDL